MTQHYFSASPEGELRPREIEVELAGAPRSVVTAGGVFSPEQLDRGTAILLREIPEASSLGSAGTGPLLDIGCGWGPIALGAALQQPEREIWAVDVNERSRELTRLNAERLSTRNVRVAAPEEVPEDVRFGEIRSNPPIRVGKEALHGILRLWLPRLADGGIAHLVVAKHLGADSLQRWIATEFTDLHVERAARDKGFHIIRIER
ncbi:class I SAM-dependent methyltransferase [Leucobacter sp. USHLN153]|uniref:class I SAM-dependent methyltransferase n=1 Tax=Leucobacter sp. USHLN153 TaxID=3081268 RepID=UPI00301A27A6